MENLNEEPVVAQKHKTQLRVRYAETDQMGVVYHANYLVWMEIGRVELVRALGLDYKRLEETDGLFLTVVEVNCRYISSARYDDEITVETHVSRMSPRSIEFSYEIRRLEGARALAEGITRHVWINREFRPVRLPAQYQSALAATMETT